MLDLRRTVAVALVACLGVGAFAASADAAIEIVDAESAHLATIEKGKCAVKKRNGNKEFRAKARSTDGSFRLQIDLRTWEGFGSQYLLQYGTESQGFFLIGPDGAYSNGYPFPGGNPPGAGGAIVFGNNGKRLSLGFSFAPNYNYSQSVGLAGAMKCKYPRKH